MSDMVVDMRSDSDTIDGCNHMLGFFFTDPEHAEKVDVDSLELFGEDEEGEMLYFNFCPWCGEDLGQPKNGWLN